MLFCYTVLKGKIGMFGVVLMIEVRTLQLDKTKRTIVISDIHANLELFKKLLKKVEYGLCN